MFIKAPTDSITVHQARSGPAPELIARLASYPAANIGDALDRLGLMHSDIGPAWPGARCAGVVLPVLTREGDNLAIHRALDEVQPGDVLVVNGMGDRTRAVFGDLMAEICQAREVAGVIVDGAVRDVGSIAELGLAVFARATTPSGPTKNGPGIVGNPVACGGVVCEAGDVIVADGDGVVVVPLGRVEHVLKRLSDIDEFEAGLRDRIKQSR